LLRLPRADPLSLSSTISSEFKPLDGTILSTVSSLSPTALAVASTPI